MNSQQRHFIQRAPTPARKIDATKPKTNFHLTNFFVNYEWCRRRRHENIQPERT